MFFYDVMDNNNFCSFLKYEISYHPNPCTLRTSSVELFQINSINIQRNLESPLNQMCKLAHIVKELFCDLLSRSKFKNILNDNDSLNIKLKQLIQNLY